jgi:hypothetical protein
MVAAKVQLVGNIAFTRIDIFSVQIGPAFGSVKLVSKLSVPLVPELCYVPYKTGHGIDAPDRTVTPGPVE